MENTNNNMNVKHCTLIRPLSCNVDTPVVEVAKALRDNKQRRIIVVDDKPVGIISTTDMNNKVVAENIDANTTRAKDIMTAPIFLVADLEDDLGEIYQKMIEHQSFFVPVTKEGKLYGVLTYGEIISHVKEAIENANTPRG
jgi:CBS domain-containing protein